MTDEYERSESDLRDELNEQILILRNHCSSFDDGHLEMGKPIGLSLRLLLHQTDRSHALLDQLHLKDGLFCSSASQINPNNLIPTHCGLVYWSIQRSNSSNSAQCEPLVHAGESPYPITMESFDNWWGQIVIKDRFHHTWSRKQIVLHIANKDGGAHVDPKLTRDYVQLSKSNSLGLEVDEDGFGLKINSASDGEYDVVLGNENDNSNTPEGRVELACMRQIAYELIETLKMRNLDWLDA